MKEIVTNLNELHSVIVLSTPIEDRTQFAQAPKTYYGYGVYFQTFLFELYDGTILLSDIISSDNQNPNDEFISLGFPRIITYCESGSLKLTPYFTDILAYGDITKYGIPNDQILELFHIIKDEKSDYFSLISGEESHSMYPETFHIPDRKERENITNGTNVKLIFKENLIEDYDETITERMWVKIIESDNTSYVGTINNIPFEETFMQYGDIINFSAEHVIDIEPQYLSSLAA